ncbi:MAG TPA: thioredoxin family protein [Candidatus Sulfotelmatobacter sp.]|nr:thioredoxin family protein [Candidatus Sulfotelmatobacter sp.]
MSPTPDAAERARPRFSGRRAHRSQRGRIPAGHPRQQSSRPGGFLGRWCGPCRRAAPHVAQTARDLAARAVVLKVDTEKFSALAAQYNVRGIPNFAVFSHGRLVFQHAGRVDAATMQHWLTRAA